MHSLLSWAHDQALEQQLQRELTALAPVVDRETAGSAGSAGRGALLEARFFRHSNGQKVLQGVLFLGGGEDPQAVTGPWYRALALPTGTMHPVATRPSQNRAATTAIIAAWT